MTTKGRNFSLERLDHGQADERSASEPPIRVSAPTLARDRRSDRQTAQKTIAPISNSTHDINSGHSWRGSNARPLWGACCDFSRGQCNVTKPLPVTDDVGRVFGRSCTSVVSMSEMTFLTGE